MKQFTLILILILSSNAKAVKQLSAHVHGSVGLDIAADGKQILIMLKSPSDSFLGFEYKARTKKEIALVKTTKETWMKNVMSLVGGKALSNCTQGQSQWKIKYEGSHSKILGEAYLNCKSKVAGKEIIITLKEKYSRIDTIHLQLLRSDGSALSKKIKDKKYYIKL